MMKSLPQTARPVRSSRCLALLTMLGLLTAMPLKANLARWVSGLGKRMGPGWEGSRSEANGPRYDSYLEKLHDGEIRKERPAEPGEILASEPVRIASKTLVLPSLELPGSPDATRTGPTQQGSQPNPRDHRPTIREAFEAVAPPRTATDALREHHSGAQQTSQLVWKLGYDLPRLVLRNLSDGVLPLASLLESHERGLQAAGSRSRTDALHEALLGVIRQIQGSHELVQQGEELLGEAEEALASIAGARTQQTGIRASRSLAALDEVVLTGRRNLASTISFLRRARAELGSAFKQARHGQAVAEKAQDRIWIRGGGAFTLEDDPEDLAATLEVFRLSLGGARRTLSAFSTAGSLLEVGRSALIESLFRLREFGPIPGGATDAELRLAIRRIDEASGKAQSLARSVRQRLARQRAWARALRGFRNDMLDLEPIPDWVLTSTTIPLSVREMDQARRDLNVEETRWAADTAGVKSLIHSLEELLGEEAASAETGPPPEEDYTLPAWY